MSVRPQQVAEEASRFSLRSVFSGFAAGAPEPEAEPAVIVHAPTAAALSPPSPPLAAMPSHLPAPAHQGGGLRFDLSLGAHAAGVPFASQQPLQQTAAPAAQPPLLSLPLGNNNNPKKFSFQLPELRGNTKSPTTGESGGDAGAMLTPAAQFAAGAAGGMASEGTKMLRAGYLSGGSTGGSAGPEIMRLNGVIDDLQTKLRKNGERLGATEQSVARGNAALQSERATSHARIVALAGEVKQAQQREAQVRAEMAAMPKVSDFDKQKFEMQARGAVELESKYNDELARAQALEEVLGGLRATHEAQTAEHEALQTRLSQATEQLETALMDAVAAREEARIAAETVTVTTAAATPVPEEDPRVSLETIHKAVASSLAARELSMAPSVDEAYHNEVVEKLKLEMGALRERLAETELHYETERHRNVEADVLIKSLDLKIATLRDEAAQRTDAAAAAPTAHCGEDHAAEDALSDADSDLEFEQLVATYGKGPAGWPSKTGKPSGGGRDNNPPRKTTTKSCDDDNAVEEALNGAVVQQFNRYFELKKAAQASTDLARATAATNAQVEDARDKIAAAQRAFVEIATGKPLRPGVYSCTVEQEHACCDTGAGVDLASFFEPRLDDSKLRLATASCCDFDAPVDLHAHKHSPLDEQTGAPLNMSSHTAEAVSLKMRTDAYVTAVSKDIKGRLRQQQQAWSLAATGKRPEGPQEEQEA